MSNALFIPHLDRLTEPELYSQNLSKHTPKIITNAHWKITIRYELDDEEEYIERDVGYPGRQGYTIVNTSLWEAERIEKWLAEKSKQYNYLFLSEPEYFPDADIDNWRNFCYCTCLPHEILDEFRELLDKFPATPHYFRITLDKDPEEVEDTLLRLFDYNWKYFPYRNTHHVLFERKEDANHFLWAI